MQPFGSIGHEMHIWINSYPAHDFLCTSHSLVFLSVIHSKWNARQPDNYHNKEPCLHILASRNPAVFGRWNDIPCNVVKAALCEKSRYHHGHGHHHHGHGHHHHGHWHLSKTLDLMLPLLSRYEGVDIAVEAINNTLKWKRYQRAIF